MHSAQKIILGVGLLVAGAWLTGRAVTPPQPPPVLVGPLPPVTKGPVAPPILPNTVTYKDAYVLGLVEGVTEYLPISSTGHLIIASHLLGLDSETPLLDHQGQPIQTHHHGETKVLTLKAAVDTYNIIVQGGAILAVLMLYWRRVLTLLRGAAGRDPQGLLVLRNLVLAFIPSAVLGLLAEHWIDAHLFSYKVVAAAFAVGAFVMLGAEYWRKSRDSGVVSPGIDLHELSCRQALLIGVGQCFSLWPGMSRSMTAIVGGYFAGLRPVRAAEFSFLLGLMTLTAASVYKAVGHWSELRQGFEAGPLVLGVVVATASAMLAVRWLVGWLTRHGLAAFAWYRLAAAAVVLAVM